jgi:hypothetical protein
MSMSSHSSPRQQTDNWLTPPPILDLLGQFDLDPCCPAHMPWRTADLMLSNDLTTPITEGFFEAVPTDGLIAPWFGRVFLNPPWGRAASPWLKKMASHNNGIALIPARTETRDWFNFVWPVASAVCFLKGRPRFHYPDGTQAKANCGCPVALVAYGTQNILHLRNFPFGKMFDLRYA